MLRQLQLFVPQNTKAQYLRIAESVRNAIRAGSIRPGEMLPSTREIAAELGFHRQTVMSALDELTAEGWIEPEYRKGYRISSTLPEEYLIASARFTNAEGFNRSWDQARSVNLSEFGPKTSVKFNFQSGLPDLRCFPLNEFRSHLIEPLRRASALKFLGYGPPEGDPGLIEEVQSYLRRVRGISDREVFITHGSQEAIYILIQILLNPGDSVALEELTYPAAREAFRFARCQVFPIQMDSGGIDPDALDRLVQKEKIRMIYLTPLHQFPTTTTLSVSRRMRIYEIACKNNILILEDDYDHEFHYRCQPLPPMASEDPNELVLYVSTFSKILFPSARIGFMAIPKELKPKIRQFRRITSHQNDSIIQAGLASWYKSGGLERHVRRMRRIYEERRNILIDCLENAKAKGLDLSWKVPDGGMALWLKLAVNSKAIADLAEKRGLFVSSEADYLVNSAQVPSHLRLGFSSHTPEELREGVSLLTKTLLSNK